MLEHENDYEYMRGAKSTCRQHGRIVAQKWKKRVYDATVCVQCAWASGKIDFSLFFFFFTLAKWLFSIMRTQPKKIENSLKVPSKSKICSKHNTHSYRKWFKHKTYNAHKNYCMQIMEFMPLLSSPALTHTLRLMNETLLCARYNFGKRKKIIINNGRQPCIWKLHKLYLLCIEQTTHTHTCLSTSFNLN